MGANVNEGIKQAKISFDVLRSVSVTAFGQWLAWLVLP